MEEDKCGDMEEDKCACSCWENNWPRGQSADDKFYEDDIWHPPPPGFHKCCRASLSGGQDKPYLFRAA
eukprot:9882123-Lingulodinium_polyedra.AAC.1